MPVLKRQSRSTTVLRACSVWVILICYFVFCSRFGFFFSVSKTLSWSVFNVKVFVSDETQAYNSRPIPKERSCSVFYVIVFCKSFSFCTVIYLNQFLLDSFAWSVVIAIYSKRWYMLFFFFVIIFYMLIEKQNNSGDRFMLHFKD